MKVVYARTNAEFLNEVFGTNYKAWMKCGWDCGEDTMVWMIELNNDVKYGWKNSILDDGNVVREDYVGNEADKLDGHKRLARFHRIIVKKERYGRYIIMGYYRYDFENSVEKNKRIWLKISDEINRFI